MSDWEKSDSGLSKSFRFTSFKEAMGFVNIVAAISEKMNHHPDIQINYNVVRLTLFTHSKNAITEKDEQLAKEIDSLGFKAD